MLSDQTDRPLRARLRLNLETAGDGNEGSLFALFDGARIHGLSTLLRTLQFDFVSLYAGRAERDLPHVAPYLTRLPWSEETFAFFDHCSIALASAVFLVAGAQLSELRNHFRRFLLVLDGRRRDVYLRFYDPRVLAPFLSACDEEEKRQFFGPVRRILIRDLRDAELSTRPALLSWRRPATPIEGQDLPFRPGGLSKFTLRPEHETAFHQEALERYEQRAGAYLRDRFPKRLGVAPEPEVRSYLRRAREIAPALQILGGRDVTVLAEVLVCRDDQSVLSYLRGFSPKDRHRELWALRDHDRAASGEMK